MTIARILMANDFSPASAAALTLATELARRLHASVDVLHVFEPPRPPFGEPMLPAQSEHARTLASLVREQTSAEMQRCVRSLQQLGIDARGRIEGGSPAAAILSAAAGYDLLVMGTHGRRGLARFVNGSVAEAVVRQASCPVLTARSSLDRLEVAHGG
jgi:nucleotide-binding universal stress UspA family protein